MLRASYDPSRIFLSGISSESVIQFGTGLQRLSGKTKIAAKSEEKVKEEK